MITKKKLLKNLRIPVVQAPMFLVSNVDLVVESAKAGIIGTMPSQNARSSQILDDNIKQIRDKLKDCDNAFWGINVITHSSFTRAQDDIDIIVKNKVPIVISALGSPKKLIEAVHSYGGLVFADVVNIYFAKKAIDNGVDGLVLIASGAGGHTGSLNPFVFVAEVRKFFDGIIVLGGGITSGEQVLATQIIGADLAYMGTRFIATKESAAQDDYKQMILDSDACDVVLSNQVTGVNANWLRPSLNKAKLNSYHKALSALMLLIGKYLPAKFSKPNFTKLNSDKLSKKWKDIYSSGQGVGAIDSVLNVKDLVDNLVLQYDKVLKNRNVTL